MPVSRSRRRAIGLLPAALLLAPLVSSPPASAAPHWRGHSPNRLIPGDLLVSTSVFPEGGVDITSGQTQLPPNCGTGPYNDGGCAAAVADGTYPYVFNNANIDGSFGLTSKIVLDELDANGQVVSAIEVPNSTEPGVRGGSGQMVTSFSSKSELSLNLSPDGRDVTFMGYEAPVGALDVSNSDTPGVDDQSANPTTAPYYRVIAALGRDGRFHFTLTNAFSGDNGRAAILNTRANVIYMAGNADDASGTNFIASTGAQITTPSHKPESAQHPGTPTPVGSFSTSELGDSETKDVAKDNNYRGIAIEDGVLYFTKGSGGKGVSTVYFVDTTGKACPDGVGLPEPGAALPTTPLAGGNPLLAAEQPPRPYNMCILKGFPTTLNHDNPGLDYPFGLFFANSHTLYVADEGNGTSPTSSGDYSAADPASNPTAGLQKWVLSGGSWHLAYTLQSGLGLGQPYSVAGYPTGTNPATGAPWAPATDGLRDITGRVSPNGTVTIYGVTSTVSGSGDQGADPNKLVAVTDQLGATSPPSGENFRTLRSAPSGTVFRGVSFTPGTRNQG